MRYQDVIKDQIYKEEVVLALWIQGGGATSVFLSTDGVTGPRGLVTEAAMIRS